MHNQIQSNLEEYQRIFVKNYLCTIQIGVYPHEKHHPQKVRLNVTAYLQKQYTSPKNDALAEVYDYDTLIQILTHESQKHGVQLQETLCNNIAKSILKDKRVFAVFVSSEKLAAYNACESVGVQILEFQPKKI